MKKSKRNKTILKIILEAYKTGDRIIMRNETINKEKELILTEKSICIIS